MLLMVPDSAVVAISDSLAADATLNFKRHGINGQQDVLSRSGFGSPAEFTDWCPNLADAASAGAATRL